MFSGSIDGDEAIQRTVENKMPKIGDSGTAIQRSRGMTTSIGRETPILRKSTVLGDAQGKISRPIYNFAHFVDYLVSKAHNYLKVKKEDEQSNIARKCEIKNLSEIIL